MLNLNTTNRVTFEVNVQGTASQPVVRCVLGDAPSMSFLATKLDGDTYEVTIDVPLSIKEGTHPFKVEVLLNGKLFTPINTTIQVSSTAEPVLTAPEPVQEVEPTPTPAATAATAIIMQQPKIESLFAKVLKTEQVQPASKPVKIEQVQRAAPKPVQLTTAPALSQLETLIKQPVQRIKKAAPAALPIVKTKTAQFSMAAVANEAHNLYDTPAPVASPKRVVEQVKTIPLTVVKGEIIYR